jgi:copper(I)-binding protein
MNIEDALSGRTARVDEEFRLKTFAITQNEDKHTNVEGDYNSLYFQVTPAGAGDYFWYLVNDGDEDVTITDIRISSTVVSQINLHAVTGTPTYVTGTDTQVTNRNLGSNKIPDVTSKFDTDITVIASTGILLFDELSSANDMHHMKTTSNIIIPQGQAIALERVAATGLITCLISLTKANS